MLLAASRLPDLPTWELLVRLGLAAGLGGAIGIERQLREREAGLRTHMLVSMGSALFTIVSAYGFREVLDASPVLVRTDPTRIAAQIVTGIGFLGAGAIIRQGGSIRGLTTAATLWLTAAIGMAAGAGSYTAAILTTALALFSLWPLRIVAFHTLERFQDKRISVRVAGGGGAATIIERLERSGVRVESFAFGEGGDAAVLSMTVDLPSGLDKADLLRELAELDAVKGVEWGIT